MRRWKLLIVKNEFSNKWYRDEIETGLEEPETQPVIAEVEKQQLVLIATNFSND